MPDSDRPGAEPTWPTADAEDDITAEQTDSAEQWPEADDDATPEPDTDEPVWPDDEPTTVIELPQSVETLQPAEQPEPDRPVPVSNEQARRDPPTIQFTGPLPETGDAPTIRVPIPNPKSEPKTEVIPEITEAEPEQTRPDPEPTAAAEPRRKRRKPLLIGLALIVIIGIGAGVALTNPSVLTTVKELGIGGRATLAPPSPLNPAFGLRPVDSTAVQPTAQGVAKALSGLAANPVLGTLTGSVVDPLSGTTLWQHDASTPATPASAGKLLASAAALLTLDPQTRLTTTVVAGPDPQTVVLVAGGDPTLSSLPAGKESVYPGAAHLDDLVNQVKQHVNGPIRRVVLDESRYTGNGLAPGWDSADITGGSVAPITPIMLDGGRNDPQGSEAPRTNTPDLDAAREFAKRLGADPSQVVKAAAPADAQVLGSVSSAPLIDLVANLLRISDNVLAEAVARQVAIATGAEPSFSGASSAVLTVLRNNGFDLAGATMVDSSGLSTMDRLPASLLSSILKTAAAPVDREAQAAKLRPLLTGLPVAGGTGTLSDRYADSASAAGKGWVRAKTGTLDGVNTLAGVVLDTDNRVLVFAFMSKGSATDAGRSALDALAAALRGCGCR